ncbi:MAG: HlyD family efflux transporter periplasmic adaptor subunit [Myxococcota bacterium]
MEASARLWLDLQCRTIPGVVAGVVLRAEAGTPDAKPLTTWPGEAPLDPELRAAARLALEEERPVIDAPGGSRPCRVAVPLPAPAGASLVAAITLESGTPVQTAAAAGALERGAAWLQALAQSAASGERLRTVLHLIAACLEPERLRDGATAVATELATRFGCERVAVGLLRGQRIRVEALSHSAHFDERTQLVRDLAAAMEEATDQDRIVALPVREGTPPCVVSAHEALVPPAGAWSVCTVPLPSGGRAIGALTLERAGDEGFSDDSMRFCADVAGMLGPALASRLRSETGVLTRGWHHLRAELPKLLEPGHVQLKLGVAAVAASLLLLLFAQGSYQVKADATLEGRVRRAIVANVEGYIAEANARAGDLVKAGQLLGQLDERDLKVELRQAQARREQHRVEYFEALAGHERTQANIVRARIAQADAQIALLEEQVSRTRLVAPFDGVVVEGDLTQSLGSPVSKGDVLFEVAPLDGYRIILLIDERDVSDVQAGGRGRLALSATPGRPLPFTVERVTPVATADEGRNVFRAEAQLDHPPEGLRPGLEGVARIDVGDRRLLWIWTHELADWLRLWLWTWWP